MKINNLINQKNIAILGFGREGKSTLEFLQNIGCKNITILDKNAVNKKDLNIITGEKYLDNLDKFDLIIKTPGISLYDKKIIPYKDKIISQTQIFFDNYKGKVIGITATKGKSTTATITYEVLKKASYNVKLVGNIGKPVLDEINLEKTPYDYIIYELSSYMLEDFNPELYIAVLGNIYIDHLDWHINFENYKQAKLNIIKNSKHNLINHSLKSEIGTINSKNNIQFFGTNGNYTYKTGEFFIEKDKAFDSKEILLKGEHNMINISSILGICEIIGVKAEVLKDTLKKFKGLKHRLENIGTYKQITFIDDAISTTPESTIEAIKTYGKNISTIFLGGTDRGYNFETLVENLKKYNIKNIVLFPESGEKVEKLLDNSFNIFNTTSMKKAVKFAFENTSTGKICILSCASPSYILWKDFEEKGNEFKKEILEYR